MINTIRISLFLKCNLSCSYCFYKNPEIISKFTLSSMEQIDFNKYNNICITGGEPFLDRQMIYKILEAIPVGKNINLYTNGILIQDNDVEKLSKYTIKGINIGLHYLLQPNLIIRSLLHNFEIKWHIQDIFTQLFFDKYPDIIIPSNTKVWTLDKCIKENEDCVLLQKEKNVE